MDSLDHMLTDPLELGPCGDGHGTRIMEDCLLGGTRVSLPEDLLEDPEIFFDVVSLSTWQEVLSDSQREHLQQFLPHFPEDSFEQQNQLILALFSGENFRFGNPLHIAQKSRYVAVWHSFFDRSGRVGTCSLMRVLLSSFVVFVFMY
uniref:Nuclear factor related to kappaB binding protein n=1 Tax=Ursus maritimus TaxID=29073 RepID=A0A452T6T8_URSMA